MQIYIHIPFCISKCCYCAFNSIVAEDILIDSYVKALCHEIEMKSSSDSIDTIYLGGGTPSILNISQLYKIFETLDKNFDLSQCHEVTMELNPGTKLAQNIKNISELPINRLSIGVQSFDDDLLKTLGRVHDPKEAIRTILAAKSSFNNVSIDLMYELPNQTVKTLIESLEMAASLDVEHISIYGLEIESDTPFGKLHADNKLPLPTVEEGGAMYELITNELPRLGYRRYEISNYAKIGFESRHNLGYWSDTPYLGLGAGAHSYNGHIRYSNIKQVGDYIENVSSNKNFSVIEEVVDKKTAMEEFCFLSLRKSEGIDTKHFRAKFGIDIERIFHSAIENLSRKGLIEVGADLVRLTEQGMKFGNIAFAEFLLD